MRRNVVTLFAILVAFAIPARAATWSIGPSVGFDIYKGSGDALLVVSAPAGTDLLFGGVKPGLRLGLRDRTGHQQVFSDMGITSVTGGGVTLHTTSASLNYAYAFRSGSSPYVTAGFGFTSFGADGSSESITTVGFGFGGRNRLRHGHGAIRVEARYDHADLPSGIDPVHIVGVRVGFDLDLN